MKHTKWIHYGVLACMVILAGWAIFSLSGYPFLQKAIGGVLAIGYVVWGIVHHTIKGDLHKRVVIEYVLVGLLALVMIVMIVE